MSLEVNLTICPQRAPSLGREPKKASRCGVPVKRPGLEPDRPGLLFSLGHCVTLTSCFPSPSLCFLFYKMRMMTQALWSGGCENLWTLRCEGMGNGFKAPGENALWLSRSSTRAYRCKQRGRSMGVGSGHPLRSADGALGARRLLGAQTAAVPCQISRCSASFPSPGLP